MLRQTAIRPLRLARARRRCLSNTPTIAIGPDAKAYSKTLLLPKTSFPLWSDPAKSELPFRKKTSEDLYRWQTGNAQGPLFVLHDGPPYANGNLHMGHALNKIMKDIINRFHVLQGRKVNYIPGWDCHGLPIENKALQELDAVPDGLSPNIIRTKAESVAKREIDTQKEEFRQFSIMADWSTDGTYRTLDHSYELRQLRIFQNMIEQGLIYRHYRPVHYSPSSRSALAEAELVYEDNHVSTSVYVTYRIVPRSEQASPHLRDILLQHKDVQLLVWTTTPWTLTANMAIAVHPDIEYSLVRRQVDGGLLFLATERKEALKETLGVYENIAVMQGSDLIGCTYVPLFHHSTSGPLNIVPAQYVTAASGTGLVHCAPAHGAEDYLALRALGLLDSPDSIICHVDSEGRFSDKVSDVVGVAHAKELIGKEVLSNGSTAMIQILQNMGVLLKQEKYQHRYPYDWKTKEPIIVMATSQWFANLDKIKDRALEALESVSFYPLSSRTRLQSFVRSRSEWCISRQRVWGVPIPSLHHIPSGRTVLDSSSLTHILSILDAKGVAAWWDNPVEDFVPLALHCEFGGAADGSDIASVWKKGTDTMDVWFDSGSSWAMLRDLGISTGSAGAAEGQLADLCLEGSDQHRGWFQSLLLTAIASASENKAALPPYGALLTHGMVLDHEGKKMSKSLGNVISPMMIINGGEDKKKDPAYGVDVLRFWAASVEYWRDMAIGPAVLAQAAESLRKIRNSARFILGNIGNTEKLTDLKKVRREEMSLAERYVMHELYKLDITARGAYAEYNFPRVVTALNHFANITLSSLYFDITKDCLYTDSVDSHQRRAVVTVLEQVLTTMTSVVAPIVPHLAEEIYHARQGGKADKGSGPSAFTQPWQPVSTEWEDEAAAADMHELLRVRSTVLSLLEKARSAKKIKSSLEAEVELVLKDKVPEITDLLLLLSREESFLKTLFIVSDAYIEDETGLETKDVDWSYEDNLSLSDTPQQLLIRVRPARLHKCPRCWTFTRQPENRLCGRCSEVLEM